MQAAKLSTRMVVCALLPWSKYGGTHRSVHLAARLTTPERISLPVSRSVLPGISVG